MEVNSNSLTAHKVAKELHAEPHAAQPLNYYSLAMQLPVPTLIWGVQFNVSSNQFAHVHIIQAKARKKRGKIQVVSSYVAST